MRSSVTGSGDYNVICKVCGWKLKASMARKRWDGLQPVCPDSCWEPRHVLEFYRPRNDFHKLPYTSPDDLLVDGFFPANNLPDTDDVVKTSEASNPSVTGLTVGQNFTCNVTGYIEAVRIYYNVPEGQVGVVGGSSPSFNRARANTSVWIGIWRVEPSSLLWSTTIYLIPGRWNTVPVVANVAVTSGTLYCVGSSSVPSFFDVVTLPAQQYATSNGMYSHATAKTLPTSTQASFTALVDIKIRKTT